MATYAIILIGHSIDRLLHGIWITLSRRNNCEGYLRDAHI